jgi:hypothetical protein
VPYAIANWIRVLCDDVNFEAPVVFYLFEFLFLLIDFFYLLGTRPGAGEKRKSEILARGSNAFFSAGRRLAGAQQRTAISVIDDRPHQRPSHRLRPFFCDIVCDPR